MTHYLHRDNTALYSLLVKTDTKMLLYFNSKSCVIIFLAKDIPVFPSNFCFIAEGCFMPLPHTVAQQD